MLLSWLLLQETSGWFCWDLLRNLINKCHRTNHMGQTGKHSCSHPLCWRMDLRNYHSHASGCECISQHLQFCKADKPRRGSKQYLIRAEINWPRRAAQIWSQPAGTRLPSAAVARKKRILERDSQVPNGTHLQTQSKHVLDENHLPQT